MNSHSGKNPRSKTSALLVSFLTSGSAEAIMRAPEVHGLEVHPDCDGRLLGAIDTDYTRVKFSIDRSGELWSSSVLSGGVLEILRRFSQALVERSVNRRAAEDRYSLQAP